jgi:hypothetical protein
MEGAAEGECCGGLFHDLSAMPRRSAFRQLGKRSGCKCKTYLFLLPREIIRRLDFPVHAAVQVRPAREVGVVHGEGEARVKVEFEVDLAVFARVDGVGVGADACGEFAVEVCPGESVRRYA